MSASIYKLYSWCFPHWFGSYAPVSFTSLCSLALVAIRPGALRVRDALTMAGERQQQVGVWGGEVGAKAELCPKPPLMKEAPATPDGGQH